MNQNDVVSFTCNIKAQFELHKHLSMQTHSHFAPYKMQLLPLVMWLNIFAYLHFCDWHISLGLALWTPSWHGFDFETADSASWWQHFVQGFGRKQSWGCRICIRHYRLWMCQFYSLNMSAFVINKTLLYNSLYGFILQFIEATLTSHECSGDVLETVTHISARSCFNTHQTIPWAPEPMGLRFWYRFSTVNVESPTSRL